jgi:hypothetical protein
VAEPRGWGVRRGPAHVRATESTLAGLGEPGDRLRPVFGPGDHRPAKHYVEQRHGDAVPETVPIAHVVVLGERSERVDVGTRRLEGPEALAGLMAHRYASWMLDRDGHERDFAVLSAVAESVPVTELTRPEGLDGAALVAEHIASLATAVA